MEWVSAKELMRAFGMEFGANCSGAAIAVCKRAHAGLLRARAKRFCTAEECRDHVDVPASFWWAEGREALDQDWLTGDFSTWIEGRYELRAFGVEFSKEDAEAMGASFQIAAEVQPPVSEQPLAAAIPAVLVNRGGNPGKLPVWHDFWMAVLSMHNEGEIDRADSQADLRRKLLAKIEDRLDDETIKPQVRKVWHLLRE